METNTQPETAPSTNSENDLMKLEPDTLRYMVADLTAALQDTETLRDRFAMAVIQGIAQQYTGPVFLPPKDIAEWCYEIADAMLEARAK